ncbi:hypothetical protein D3C73_730800 [compost metagenome]
MRGIDQTVRDQEADVFQTGVDFGGGSGEQQHHARQEHQHREDRRGQTGGCAQGLARLKQALAFVDQQQQASHQHRQHNINQAIEQQRGRQRRSAELVGEGCEQDRFEHPDTARHMTEHAGGQRQQVNQQKCAERRRFRQQQIEHGGGGCHVQCGNHQLQKSQAAPGQAQSATADSDQQVVGVRLLRQAPTVNADGYDGKQYQHGARNAAQQGFGKTQGGGGGWQVAERGESGERRQGAAERKAGEQRHVGDFSGPQSMACI